MSNAWATLGLALTAAALTFFALLLGLPLVGLSPGPTAVYVLSGFSALVSAAFVIMGENLLEDVIKSLLSVVWTFVCWLVFPSAGHFLGAAIVACLVGTVFNAIQLRLEERATRQRAAAADERRSPGRPGRSASGAARSRASTSGGPI